MAVNRKGYEEKRPPEVWPGGTYNYHCSVQLKDQTRIKQHDKVKLIIHIAEQKLLFILSYVHNGRSLLRNVNWLILVQEESLFIIWTTSNLGQSYEHDVLLYTKEHVASTSSYKNMTF